MIINEWLAVRVLKFGLLRKNGADEDCKERRRDEIAMNRRAKQRPKPRRAVEREDIKG
jgi:hypothetical protein